MTLLEMLEAVESQILELRARNDELTAALRMAQNGTSTAGIPKRARKAAPKPKTPRKIAVKRAKPQAETKERKERPVLGKRQALGRSLVQLRRLGGTSEQALAETGSVSEELITQA